VLGDLLQFRGVTHKIMKFRSYQYEALLIGTPLLNMRSYAMTNSLSKSSFRNSSVK
jgi:hypothetical protein